MAAYYLDTSALVKLYIDEAGTDNLLSLAASIERDTWAVSDLTRVEFRAAVGRRQREGNISAETSLEICSELDQHAGSLYLVQPVTSSVVEEAISLLDRHSLRAYDSVQLASCIVLSRMEQTIARTFVCADAPLLQAATDEGLTVFNPLDGDIAD